MDFVHDALADGSQFRVLTVVDQWSHPGMLRDVSVSLDNVGRVELARGNLDGASAAYAESLSVLMGLQRDGKLLPAWRNDIARVKDQLERLGS